MPVNAVVAPLPATGFEIAPPPTPAFAVVPAVVAVPAPELATVEGFAPTGAEALPALVWVRAPSELGEVFDVALVLAEGCDLSLVRLELARRDAVYWGQ